MEGTQKVYSFYVLRDYVNTTRFIGKPYGSLLKGPFLRREGVSHSRSQGKRHRQHALTGGLHVTVDGELEPVFSAAAEGPGDALGLVAL